jgi:hypothetical protein
MNRAITRLDTGLTIHLIPKNSKGHITTKLIGTLTLPSIKIVTMEKHVEEKN